MKITGTLLLCMVLLVGCHRHSTIERQVTIRGQIDVIVKGENISLEGVRVSIYSPDTVGVARKRAKEKTAEKEKNIGKAAPWFFYKEEILSGLPAPLASGISDADGKFQIEMTERGEYVIVAHATHTPRSPTTNDVIPVYYWFVPTQVSDSVAVRLSNDNAEP